nr:type II toxin-antitoxin system VapC family toxin [Serinibacter arcticus]
MTAGRGAWSGAGGFLLDTHVVLWLLAVPGRIPPDVLDTLGDRRNVLRVSAASAMEVATKVRLGRLPQGAGLVGSWSRRIAELGADPLAIGPEHALRAGSMAWEHRDPFDRILVSQAQHENLALATVDAAILALPGVRTLTW